MKQASVSIIGGGIGGLAAAVGLAKKGIAAHLMEQASAWAEVGAGIQLGPNVVGVLDNWGLQQAFAQVAAFPDRLQVCDAGTGTVLGQLRLGDVCVQRYGARYATIHRADMHSLLLHEAQKQGVTLQLAQRIGGVQASEQDVQIIDAQGVELATAGVVIGADGLWSRVRAAVVAHEAAPRFSGIVAYRTLVRQADLPAHLRSQHVTAWLGRNLHMVHYPVQAGEGLNVVALVRGNQPENLQTWDHSANAAHLQAAMANQAKPVQDLVAAIGQWRLWPLCDRPPVAAAAEMVKGRVALLGDAAHPMRPFMAQGAGMAIEDAAVLSHCLQQMGSTPEALQRYASLRWQRCARVQQRSIRNGEIFHAQGVMRLGRDLSMRLLGEHILDVPWLYGDNTARNLAKSA